MAVMEIWEYVPGYEGKYRVSNLGNIQSKIGKSNWKPMVKRQHHKGYLEIGLRKIENGRSVRKIFKIHRLVAMSFIPNSENKPQINHKNGIKADNRVENLEWCTGRENILHAVENKLLRHLKGSNHPIASFSEKDICAIRELYKAGNITQVELAKRYNSHQTVISRIVREKTYVRCA